MVLQSPTSPVSIPQRSLKWRLLAGSASLLLARMVMLVCGLAIFIYLSRALGPAGYGIYGLAVAISRWSSLVMVAVAGGATIPLVAGHKLGDRFAITILQVTLGVGIWLASLMALGAPWLAQVLKAPELTLPLQIIALDIPLAGLASVHSQVLTARSQFHLSAGLMAGYWISRISLSWLLVQAGTGIVGAATALPLASLIYAMAGRYLSGVPLWSRQAMPVQQLLTYNRMRTASSLLSGILGNVDMVAVQWWSESAQITGLYAAAKNMALLPAMVFTSGQSVILSTLSKSYGQGKTGLTDHLGRQYLRTCLYLGGLIIALGTLSLKGMAIVLGPSYGEAGPIAAILIAEVGLELLSTSALILISARGERGTMAPALAIVTPLALALYYWLPGQLPLMSAGMSQALISLSIIALIATLALRKMIFICHTSLPWRSFACTAMAMGLAIAAGLGLNQGWLPVNSKITLGVQGLLVTLIYLMVLWGLGENFFRQEVIRR